MQNCENSGLLKENAKAAPWILDPTTAGARVRRGPRCELGSGSTIDRTHNPKGYVIWAVHARSKGSGRLQAKGGGEHAGVQRRATEGSPAHPNSLHRTPIRACAGSTRS
jgi:hypothetical protein